MPWNQQNPGGQPTPPTDDGGETWGQQQSQAGSEAEWVPVGDIKGPPGADGDKGDKGEPGDGSYDDLPDLTLIFQNGLL